MARELDPARRSRDPGLPRRLGLAVSGVTVLLTLVASELVLSHFTTVGIEPLKVSFSTTHGFGHCYRSNDPGLPIDLLHADERAAFSRILMGEPEDLLRQGATRCVAYDLRRRRAGAHPERGRQVAIVGDSFAFGEGLPDGRTLDALLAERFPDIGFFDFGVSGAGVFQVRDVVERVLDDPRRPTDILYFYNVNDVQMTEEMSRRFSYVMDFENVRLNEAKSGAVANFLARQSVVYRLADRAWFMQKMSRLTTQNYLDMYFADVNAKALDATFSAMATMVGHAKERGIQFWIVVYPLLYKDAWGRYPFAPIHRLMLDACHEWGARCIDGAHAFEGQRKMTDYVVDRSDFHPNVKADVRMVDYLASVSGFLSIDHPSEFPAHDVRPVRVPRDGLSERSPEVVVEDVQGRPGEYPVNGPMLSVEVEPESAGSFVLALRGRAEACADASGEKWPVVHVYVGDRLAAKIRVDGTESKSYESDAFSLRNASTLRLAFSNDYDGNTCDRKVYIDEFSLRRAEQTGVP